MRKGRQTPRECFSLPKIGKIGKSSSKDGRGATQNSYTTEKHKEGQVQSSFFFCGREEEKEEIRSGITPPP